MGCGTFRETKLYAAINSIVNIHVYIERERKMHSELVYYTERYLPKAQLLLG